nr:prepilin-type N-terminal cleavage/methylation domain-containing protein [Halorhodospira halochloris]
MTVSRGPSSFRNQSGLTLLELIVSIVVLGFAMAAFAAIFTLFQVVGNIEDADRFARKAQGCAELIIACDREDGEDGFDTSVSNCGSGSKGDYRAIDDNDLGGFFACSVATDFFVDEYCGNSVIKEIACATHNSNTYFEIRSDEGYQSIFFGIDPELN